MRGLPFKLLVVESAAGGLMKDADVVLLIA